MAESKNKLTVESVRTKYEDHLKSGEKLLKKNKKGYVFQYFIAKYEEVYQKPVVIPNKLIAFNTVNKLLDTFDVPTLFDILDYFVEQYKEKWSRQGYTLPSLNFLPYVANEIVQSMESDKKALAESSKEVGGDSLWI